MAILHMRFLKLFSILFFCLICTLLSGCASFPNERDGEIVWQSAPQAPVWISHELKTSPSILWFVGKGTSGRSKKIAFSKARSAAYEKIWGWFSIQGIRVVPQERIFYEATWAKNSPLAPKYSFSLENCHQISSPTICDNWFVQRARHPERRESWVLVSVETAFLEKLKESFLSEDKNRLTRMLERDRSIKESLSKDSALPAILALEKNQLSSSLFHSQTMMSSDSRQQLERLDQKTFGEIWTIRRSLTLSPYKTLPASLTVPVGESIRIPFRWKLFFRINGKVTFVKGLPLDLFLDPSRRFPDFPFLFLFPPSGFSEKRIVWPYQSLVLSGDLASLQKIRRSPWIEKKCGVTDYAGVASCVLSRILILRHRGRICVRPFDEESHRIPNVFRGMTSCLPVSFYHRRELHGVSLKITVDRGFDQPFLKKLSQQLQVRGFLIHPGEANRYTGNLHVLSVNRKRVGGATLYSEVLSFRARLVDQNGVVRWGRTIISRGFGFSGGEAERDAVKWMVVRVVRSMDRSVRRYNDPIASSFLGRMVPIRNALVPWALNR